MKPHQAFALTLAAIVLLLLAPDIASADVTAPAYRQAVSDTLDIVRLLLERGADPTWPDADGSERGAALHAAAGRGDMEMVELLLKHHADPNGFVNASGNAVYAAKTPEIRRLLEAHGGFLDPYDLVWKGEDDEVMRIVTERPETALAGPLVRWSNSVGAQALSAKIVRLAVAN